MANLSCPRPLADSPPASDEDPHAPHGQSIPAGTVLLIDDDPSVLRLLEFELGEAGVQTVAAATGRRAQEILAKTPLDAIVLDLALPDLPGRELLQEFQAAHPEIPVIVLTARDEVEEAVACMRLGARDFVTKPFDRTRLLTSVANACAERRLHAQLGQMTAEARRQHGFDRLLGHAPAIARAKALLARAVPDQVTVLFEGESGVGKETFARALHAESARASGPFVRVNCSAIPESQLEAQLFGHRDATGNHPGFFEQAEGGTILLDEVSELPPSAQVRLLRVLQERTLQRDGEREARAVDLRVIAATNRPLEPLAKSGRFRLDLYYRLAVFPIALLPLRERPEDIPLLTELFLERSCARQDRPPLQIDARAQAALQSYAWPGNVRELENAIERACLLASGEQIGTSDLPDAILDQLVEREHAAERDAAQPRAGAKASVGEVRPLAEEERRLILRALELTDWNLSQAAQQLGIGRATIYRKIDRYGLSRDHALRED